MTKKYLRLTILSAATAISLSGMATSASATSYGDCVRATWDPIGCALNPDYQEWGLPIFGPEGGKIDNRTKERAMAMVKSGVFKNLVSKNPGVFTGKLQRTCDLTKLLDMVEKSVSAKEIRGACYRNVK